MAYPVAWACNECGEPHSSEQDADECELDHMRGRGQLLREVGDTIGAYTVASIKPINACTNSRWTRVPRYWLTRPFGKWVSTWLVDNTMLAKYIRKQQRGGVTTSA